jgi:hypothetical protein
MVSQLLDASDNIDEFISLNKQFPDKKITVYEDIKPHMVSRGHSVRWPSLLDEVGYWRKAYAIHHWFVHYVQNNVDNCEYFEVSREQISGLFTTCLRVMGKQEPSHSYQELPIGSTYRPEDYQKHYYQTIVDTLTILDDILQNFDFDNNYLMYRASW